MVKTLFNSLSIPKECCNLKSTNQLVLLIISLANPGFKSHINLKTIQNDKQEGQHSIYPGSEVPRSVKSKNASTGRVSEGRGTSGHCGP